ncbi:hypothetical protein TrRE_jg2410 [Triparma retinervis]|uniref:Uncharacterized protein n=1 Tax=Triparma retinervis TaxID=2557542 RepID=A0A9W6ZK81_9STRA|nr:hypothetical protein TrRE_jg2410 [Triparma retinervis]
MSNPEVTGWSTPEYEDFELFFGEGIKTSDNKAIAPTSFNLPDNREDLAKRNEDMSEYWFGEAPASAATEVINEYTGLPIFHEKKRSRLSYDSSNSELENAMNYAMSFVETVDTPPKVPAKKTTSNKSDDESENGCNDGEVTMIEDSPIPVAGAASPALPHDKVETFCCLIIDNSVQRISVKETARIMKLREANLEKALNKSHLATCCTTKTPQDAPKQFRVKYWCEINSPEALEELLICDNFHFNSVKTLNKRHNFTSSFNIILEDSEAVEYNSWYKERGDKEQTCPLPYVSELQKMGIIGPDNFMSYSQFSRIQFISDFIHKISCKYDIKNIIM